MSFGSIVILVLILTFPASAATLDHHGLLAAPVLSSSNSITETGRSDMAEFVPVVSDRQKLKMRTRQLKGQSVN